MRRDHQHMLDLIEQEVRYTASSTGITQLSREVMAAMRDVPRHAFVPADLAHLAYVNEPLPIGHGQTISQPYIVALMTGLLALKNTDTVLEIGTGCGYQAAVLSLLARQVYTLDVVEELATQAAGRLARLGYDNVDVRVSDGHAGLPEHAPFDAIIVTAAPEAVPVALIRQLKSGGRMVIPVGAYRFSQSLLLVEKDAAGDVHEQDVLPVAFVPMVHDPEER